MGPKLAYLSGSLSPPGFLVWWDAHQVRPLGGLAERRLSQMTKWILQLDAKGLIATS